VDESLCELAVGGWANGFSGDGFVPDASVFVVGDFDAERGVFVVADADKGALRWGRGWEFGGSHVQRFSMAACICVLSSAAASSNWRR
jgi:hypothetical protein